MSPFDAVTRLRETLKSYEEMTQGALTAALIVVWPSADRATVKKAEDVLKSWRKYSGMIYDSLPKIRQKYAGHEAVEMWIKRLNEALPEPLRRKSLS